MALLYITVSPGLSSPKKISILLPLIRLPVSSAMYIPSRWLYATGKDMYTLVPRGMTDGSTATVLPTVARVPEAVIPYAGCSRVLPQLLYERSYAVAVILIILLHWGMMSAISTFVRLTWVWADFASVAEFDLAVSFDLETGVLWVFEVFLLSMLF